ncbi:acyl-CoA reductase [Halalkalibacter wakoensis JCM 9140]|uniref:Acyl-CoA reductase n=1 Tax=Halalkalibacter wakoensis JCM 9140 TaxID=1236970 RepID=W4Q4G5_9BACI|nr:acyl-CoA reductase [Halalkalibacter wakoensis]GAE26956.1 acyl-CoA reductase [Halalkalibacter wakoensis JCM 9140]
MTFSCYHVPSECESLISEGSFQTLEFENHGQKIKLTVPTLTVNQLDQVIHKVKRQQRDYVRKLQTNEIITIFDKAVQKWLDPSYEKRQQAEELLPIITGYDREMVRLFISRYLRQFRKENLQRMIDEDFSNPLILDEFRPRKAGGLYRAFGPNVVTHIFSGNVPALPLWSLAAGILLKSATIGKVSSSEPLFPVLFAKTIAEIDPALGDSLAILWWKGGESALESTSFSASNAVIAYGGKETIEQVRQKVPTHVTFHPHGHKVSFGLITKECLQATKSWETAKLAASDVSWFDQQGCLSPHVFFVERGGTYTPSDFAQMLANEMENFERTHPRASLNNSEKQAILTQRTKVEFESYESTELQLLKSENGTAWSVVYSSLKSEKKAFPISPLNRFVTVIPINHVSEITEYLSEVKGFVQTVGVGCSPQAFSNIINLLGDCGVNRICALGSMPHPQPGWHHDGRFHLADLVTFCDVESTLEMQMDLYDVNRD